MTKSLAIVTGAADGIGAGIATCFHNAGYNVAICDANPDAVERVRDRGLQVMAEVVDVEQADRLSDFIRTAVDRFGAPAVLVNNVGIAGQRGNVEDLDGDDWEHTMRVNVSSMFHAIKATVPAMKERRSGTIINLSSMGTRTIPTQRSVYNTSKWAVEGLTRSLSRELGPFGIRCNAILPGVVSGARMDRIMQQRAQSENRTMEELHAEYVEGVAMNTFVAPEDIGEMAVFLGSDKARFVTGQLVAVCGGIQWEN